MTIKNPSIDENQAAWLMLFAALAVHWAIVVPLHGPFALDVDPVNLAYGMQRFDLAEHAPHPPGYWLYVQALRGLHVVLGGGDSLAARFATTQWLSLLFSSGSILLVFLAARRLRPLDPALAGLGALLTALHPFLIYHAVDAQTHNSEAFAGALLLLLLVRYHQDPSFRRAVLLGLALALGSAFRPTFVILGVMPIVLACRERPLRLLAAGAAALAGAVCWIVPTLVASGGWGNWKLANDALVGQTFVSSISPLSPTSVPAIRALQLLSTGTWVALLLVPVLVAFLLRVARGRRRPRPEAAGYVPVGTWAIAACGPLFAANLLLFCSEPGYLSGAVPFLVAATIAPDSAGRSRFARFLPATAALLASLGILFAPSFRGTIAKLPSLVEVVERGVLAGIWFGELDQRVPAGRLLVVGDGLDVVLARQTPLQRPRAHYLHFAAGHWSMFERTTASLVTEERFLPIPGPAHLVQGPPTVIDVPCDYDWVLIDRMASSQLRRGLEADLACPGGAGEYGEFALFAAHCFRDNIVAFDGQGIRFAAGNLL